MYNLLTFLMRPAYHPKSPPAPLCISLSLLPLCLIRAHTQQFQMYNLLVVVRGTVKYMSGVQLAVTSLLEYFTGDLHTGPLVSLQLDIAAQHHRTLIGSSGGNVRKIMTETNTTYVCVCMCVCEWLSSYGLTTPGL